MAIVKIDPFKDILSIQERMNRLFEDTLFKTRGMDENLTHGAWSPAVDIYEGEKNFVLKAELPGLSNSDISIEVKDNLLVLKGDRRFERDLNEANYCRVERSYGTFCRSFNLPNNVIQEKVKARFVNGILEITLPKEEMNPEKVIKVAVT